MRERPPILWANGTTDCSCSKVDVLPACWVALLCDPGATLEYRAHRGIRCPSTLRVKVSGSGFRGSGLGLGGTGEQPSLFLHCLPVHGAVSSGPSLAALLVTETRAGLVCETAGGACALPFTFDGVEHHSCAGVGAEAWCSLTPIFQGQRADCPDACLSQGTLVVVTPEPPTFVLRCVSTCSARRCAGFMSSGPATAALSYALLIACASMPLLLPVSYFAVKLRERRQFIQSQKPDNEDGVEMELRDAFKEGRGKRATREKIDASPRKRDASQAAGGAELSKARIVQVVAYFHMAYGMGGRARY